MAAASALGAAGTAYAGFSASNTADAIRDTPTTPVPGIREPGYYEVVAEVACREPLTLPDTGVPCVHFVHQLLERWEETWNDRGRTRTRTYDTVVHEERASIPFTLRQGGSELAVDPTGATIEAEVLVNRALKDSTPDFKGLAPPPLIGSNKRLLDRRRNVVGITVGQRIYALGPVIGTADGLLMGGRDPEGRPFLLSARSESEQLTSLGRTHWFLHLAALLFAGLALLFTGLWLYAPVR